MENSCSIIKPSFGRYSRYPRQQWKAVVLQENIVINTDVYYNCYQLLPLGFRRRKQMCVLHVTPLSIEKQNCNFSTSTPPTKFLGKRL